MAVRLETQRLVLKSLEKQDSDMFYDFLMRNYEFFKPWSPKYEENYKKKEAYNAKMDYMIKEHSEGRTIKFFLFKKEDASKIIGTTVLSNVVRGPFLSCFLGYRIDEKENGNGYATEAIKKVVEYAFNELNLHRIEANIMPRNIASIKVVEKLGFTCEGISKKYLQINGVWEDHMHYVILNEKIEIK
jgi:[ribosomal protein S5]-alanine N-acetyltransferase